MAFGIFEMILLGVFLLVVLIAAYLVFETFVLFPHEYTLKLMTNRTPIVIRTRARELKGANAGHWQLLYKRLKVPLPDAKVRSITKRGKFYVEGWHFSDGQVQYEKNGTLEKVNYESIPDAVATEMLTTEQRIMLTHQFKKAEIERGKNIKEWLLQIAMPLGMALILGGVIIFGMVQWSDINKPGIDFANKMVSLEQQRTEQLKIIQEIKNDVQIIKSKEGLADVTVPADDTPPN